MVEQRNREAESGLLAPYRVLDLADAKGVYCSKVLADLGADVIKIEPPDGDPTRRLLPFAGDIPGSDRSLYFLYRNTNKRSVTLNLSTEQGRSLFRQLVATADVLVETFPPGYLEAIGLDYGRLREINPRLIMASITEFGQGGPRRDYKGAPIIAFAMSGAMQVAGFADKPPCNAPNAMAYDAAATYASVGIMLALYGRGADGQGQYIDISVQEAAIAGLYPWAVPTLSYGGVAGGPPMTKRGGGFTIYPCKDGYVRIAAVVPRHFQALVQLVGSPEVLLTPEWQDPLFRRNNQDALQALVSEFMRERTMAELFRDGQALGLPISPLQPPSGFVHDPHPQARGFFVEVEHPEVGKALYPGVPYRLSETPLSIRRPAPRLGEHNEEVYCGELGLTKAELAALRAAGVV